MSDALDRLRAVIQQAEQRLGRIPQAYDVFVPLDDDSDGGYSLGFSDIAGEGRLVRFVACFDTVDGDFRKDEEPIANLPVNERKRCCEEIPNFLVACEDGEADYVKEIDEVASTIEHALANFGGSTSSNGGALL